jgi:hypothetical protein
MGSPETQVALQNTVPLSEPVAGRGDRKPEAWMTVLPAQDTWGRNGVGGQRCPEAKREEVLWALGTLMLRVSWDKLPAPEPSWFHRKDLKYHFRSPEIRESCNPRQRSILLEEGALTLL